MKNLWVHLCLIVVMLSGCASNTTSIGDGKVDPVESATISLSVGIAMSVRPDTIMPAYKVSGALLLLFSDNSQVVTIELLEKVVFKEVDKLNLDPLTKQSFNDLITLIKAEITTTLVTAKTVNVNEKLIIIRDIIQIVYTSAANRLYIVKEV